MRPQGRQNELNGASFSLEENSGRHNCSAPPFLPSPTTAAVNPTCFDVDHTLDPGAMSVSTLAAAISQ